MSTEFILRDAHARLDRALQFSEKAARKLAAAQTFLSAAEKSAGEKGIEAALTTARLATRHRFATLGARG